MRFGWWTGMVVMALLVLAWPGRATVIGQQQAAPGARDLPRRYTAFATNLSNVDVGSRAQTIQIEISRWSTEAERERLLTTLKEQGEKKLLDTLKKLPRVGSFRTPASLAYDLRFAWRIPGEDGGERIFLATDRYINMWEVTSSSRTLDYPFTLIEMRVGPSGKGEGKLSVAARIAIEADLLVLENYADQPVMLSEVTREK